MGSGFDTGVLKGAVHKNVVDNNTIKGAARELREWNQGPVWEMAPAPEVISCRVSVLGDKARKLDVGERKKIVIFSVEEGRTEGKERNIEGPNVFERRLKTK
jgi:hypothetical protein